MSPFRDLVRGGFKYFLGGVAGRVLVLVSAPLYLRFLSVADFGAQSIALLNEGVLNILVGYAISNAVGRFYLGYRSGWDRGTVIGTAIFSLAVFGAIATLFWQAFAKPLAALTLNVEPRNILVIRWVGVAFLANLFCNLVFGVWQLEQRIFTSITVTLLRSILSIGLSLLFLARYSLGALGVVAGWAVASAAVGLLAVLWAVRSYPLRFDGALLWEMVKYGLPLVPAALLMLTLNGFDRYLLKDKIGLEAVGIYAMAMALSGFLNLALTQPFKQIWTPLMWGMRHKPEEAFFHQRTFTYYLVVQMFALLGATVFSDVGVRLLTAGKEEFLAAAPLVPVLYLASVFYGAYDVLSAGYFFEGKTHFYLATVFSSMAVNVGLNFVFIPRMGPWGCALASAASYLVFAVLSHLFGRRFFSVPFEWGRILKAGGLALAVGSLALLARQLGGWVGLLSAALSLLAFPALLWGIPFLEPDEREKIRRASAALLVRFG